MRRSFLGLGTRRRGKRWWRDGLVIDRDKIDRWTPCSPSRHWGVKGFGTIEGVGGEAVVSEKLTMKKAMTFLLNTSSS